MTYSVQQGNGHLRSISDSPCFFKIIRQYTIRNGKLELPREFVKIHGNDMSSTSPAMLRVPSGDVWKVELKKCDGKIWLENGWLQFSSHYSLEIDHFLVFRYDGNNDFHVVIFDTSATEIQYPHTSSNHRRSGKIPEHVIDESPSRKRREKQQSTCCWPQKMRRTNSTIKTGFNGKSEFLAQSVRCHVKLNDLDRASNTLKSKNPSFHVVMQLSHVGQDRGYNYRLGIPRNFSEKHLMKEASSVILRSSSGKTWMANLRQTLLRNRIYTYLRAGWGTFVRDNNIQIGDVCFFELINNIEVSFKVVIQKVQHENLHQSLASTDPFGRVIRNAQSRGSSSCPKPLTGLKKASTDPFSRVTLTRNAQSRASSSCPKPLTGLKKARDIQVAGAAKSEDPFFSVVLKPSYANYDRLIIPVNFARQYLKKMQIKVILLLTNGKSWPVKYYQHHIEGPKPFVMFFNGWHRFVVDNNLEVGDVCRFELTNGDETFMNVSVTITKKQAVEDANLGSSSDNETREKQGEQTP